MDILLLILLLVVAFQAGKHYGYFKIIKTMKEVAEEQGFDLEKELGLKDDSEEKKSTVYKLQVEKHGELLYLFDKETDSFICQGNTVEELCALAKKYKSIVNAAVMYEDKVFAFVDGKMTELG